MNIATLVQNQTLATLLQAMSPGAALAPGRTAEATLLSLDGDGRAIAQLGDIRLALILAGPVARQAALQPGATLLLGFEPPEAPGQPLRATLVEVRPPAPRPPDQPQADPADTAEAAARQPLPQAGSLPGRSGEERNLASGGTASAAPPRPANAAEGQIATAPPVTPARVAANAIPVDEIFLQAAQPPRAVAAAEEPVAPRAAAGPLLGRAMAEQDSLAPLMANLRGLSQGTLAFTLPKTLLQGADRLIAQALPLERQVPTGEMLKAAVQRSGLFFEARQAEGRSVPPQADLKASLLALREALGPVIQRLVEDPSGSRPGASSPASAPARSQPPGSLPEASAQRPPPPRRDGPPAFQPIAEPTLQPGEKPLVVAETLLRQTDAALDRVTLSQFASLPPDQPRADMQGARWVTELPLAMQAGIAMMPLHVEREPPRQGPQDAQGPLWRVRFALDVEPMGPLQGVVTLQGRHVGVSLWAVREDTSRLLRQAAPGLEAALLDASFETGGVEVHLGQPRVLQPTAGQFLDRMS